MDKISFTLKFEQPDPCFQKFRAGIWEKNYASGLFIAMKEKDHQIELKRYAYI